MSRTAQKRPQNRLHQHSVQFYDSDSYLVDSVRRFIAPSDVAIVIATPEHRSLIENDLKRKPARYIALDAEETLEKFMVDGSPDPDLFQETVGSLVRDATKGNRRVHAFGEMVAILWQKGNPMAAVRLEELWNGLLEQYTFHLFCAYPMRLFAGEVHSEGFVRVCNTHGSVTPTESYASLSEDRKDREIALLQQRSKSIQSSQFLSSIANVVPGMIAAYNVHTGKYLYVNQACRDILGYEPDDFLTGGIAFAISLVHPDDLQALMRQNEEALQAANEGTVQGPVSFEYRMRRKDGTWCWLHTDGGIFSRTNDGAVESVISVSIDITSRKETEQKLMDTDRALQAVLGDLEKRVEERTAELRESEAELNDFFENSSVGIHWVGPDETILRVNRAELEMLGYSKEEYVGRNIRDFHVNGAIIGDILARLKRGEVVRDCESQLRCKDGSIKDVLIDSSVFYRDGKFAHTRCFTRDISERKRYESALRESEAHFRALVNATSDVIYRMSPDWREMRQLDGRNFLADTGEPDREWLHKYIHRDDQDEVLAAIQRAIDGKTIFQLEHRVLQADGTLGWTFSRAVPILDADGEITEWFGAASDITSRKRHEAILKEEDKRKDDFLAILAHELRNPLSPIASATDMLQLEGNQTEYGREAVTVIQRQVQHLVRLIDDLLDISRIKRGKFELKKEPVDVREVIRAAIETNTAVIEAAGHRLITSLAPNKIYVNGDAIRLAQAVSNLLSNAARYTPPGGTIWLETEEKDGHVQITVRDSGVGIDERTLSRVFDMFVQGKQASGVNRGLGIGLTLVKRIVEMHGGIIDAKSPGQNLGSTFTMRLPIAEARLDLGGLPVRRESAIATQRILVVDDNTDALAMLAATLKMQGNEVAIAADGLEAVKAAQEFHPDVVLMDIGMPNMNGYEAAKVIRAQTERPIKLIAVTGWGQKADKVRAREAGFDAHITKPVDSKLLGHLLS